MELQSTLASQRNALETQVSILDNGVYVPCHEASTLLEARWLSRYGKWCYHGPVYFHACH